MFTSFADSNVILLRYVGVQIIKECNTLTVEYLYGTFYMPGGAHFYGEQAESTWAEFNQLGGRTRQMNSGHRHDVIDEHIHNWNWEKICGMREYITSTELGIWGF